MATRNLMPDDLPYDDEGDGDALRRLLRDGSDLSKPMEIDFCILTPDEETGRKIAALAAPLGYQVKVSDNEFNDGWTCYCTRTLVPDYDTIIEIQATLDAIARPFGGKIDGWGSFGNAPGNQPTKKR